MNSLDPILSLAIGDALKHRIGRGHGDFRLAPSYCREVARWYDASPLDGADLRVRDLYERFKRETEEQFEALLAAGFSVRPWLDAGQPYESSHELRARVVREHILYVYLTASGHGPGPGQSVEDRDCGGHPMLEASGHSVDGITFTYNDLFRAVHDLFGHVMHPNTFRIEGELRAVMSHLTMYSTEVAPVVLAESAAQICWFYYGPHLETGGDPDGIGTASPKPYPPQKVLVMTDRLVDGFWRMFKRERESFDESDLAGELVLA